jgi:integral membrane protein
MKLFRLISLIEGLSLLALLLVAVPLRVYAGLHEPVWYVGWTHGLLFLTYGALALVISHQREWSILRWLVTFLLGAVPFGFLVVDGQLKRAMQPARAGETA